MRALFLGLVLGLSSCSHPDCSESEYVIDALQSLPSDTSFDRDHMLITPDYHQDELSAVISLFGLIRQTEHPVIDARANDYWIQLLINLDNLPQEIPRNHLVGNNLYIFATDQGRAQIEDPLDFLGVTPIYLQGKCDDA